MAEYETVFDIPKRTSIKGFEEEEIEGLLFVVEESFGVSLINDDNLYDITSLGEFCDYIERKIQHEDSGGCTSQQAFYRLRTAFAASLSIDPKVIQLSTELEGLVPRRNRRSTIQQVEKELGFDLNTLDIATWVDQIIRKPLGFVVLLSIGILIAEWRVGLPIMLVSFCLWIFLNSIGREFTVKTVGELTRKMTLDNYQQVRRKQGTVNRREVFTVIRDYYIQELNVEPSVVTREASFV